MSKGKYGITYEEYVDKNEKALEGYNYRPPTRSQFYAGMRKIYKAGEKRRQQEAELERERG